MSPQTEGHTLQRFDGELNHLHMQILEMGALAYRQAVGALHALKKKDLEEARRIPKGDHELNRMEVRTDNEIVSVIARRAPMARDLRTVMGFSKIVTDIEQVGDEAARIAAITLALYDGGIRHPSVRLLRDVDTMGRMALGMLREALETLDQFDVERAEALAGGHSRLDQEFRAGLRRLATFIMEDHRNVGHYVNVVLIIKALERIGDHARNIAEYVIYLVSGDDVRHQFRENQLQRLFLPEEDPDDDFDGEES